MEPSDATTFYMVILFFAPLLTTLLFSVFNLIIDREVPSLPTQINSYSFGQAVVALAMALLVSENLSVQLRVMVVVVLLSLFVLLVLQTWVAKKIDDKTKEHVLIVLTGVNFLPDVDSDLIRSIANSLVDEDFFPGSLIQDLSGSPRRHRRQYLVDLINRHLTDKDQPSLKQEDFIVTREVRQGWRIVYLIVTLISFILYVAVIALFTSLTR